MLRAASALGSFFTHVKVGGALGAVAVLMAAVIFSASAASADEGEGGAGDDTPAIVCEPDYYDEETGEVFCDDYVLSDYGPNQPAGAQFVCLKYGEQPAPAGPGNWDYVGPCQIGTDYRTLLDHRGWRFTPSAADAARPKVSVDRIWWDLYVYKGLYPELDRLKPAKGQTVEEVLLRHYRDYGVHEGRTTSLIYSPVYYRSRYADLANMSNQALLEHWVTYGVDEGRAASPVFDVAVYRANNSDLANMSNRNLISHYLSAGANETRKTSNDFDLRAYRSSRPDLASMSNVQLVGRYLTDWVRSH